METLLRLLIILSVIVVDAARGIRAAYSTLPPAALRPWHDRLRLNSFVVSVCCLLFKGYTSYYNILGISDKVMTFISFHQN